MAIGDLTPSYEDYIEAIYDLALHGSGSVRSTDVADALGFSKASVARATKNLREMGYIEQERYGEITLTQAGREYGEHILTRHRMLRAFLIDALGVEEEAANQEACMMEHTISEDTMAKWIAWYEKNYGPVSATPTSRAM
ncbi:MAG: metal-dependent transcriptional regulator [Coriobacteriales bacterium]